MQTRALVVDDERAECQSIQAALASTGLDVLALTRSTEAEAYLRDEKFAVVLFDLRMPAPDGVELARLTRRSGINRMTPVLLISDDQSNAACVQGFAAGASFFLYKPIDKSRLLKLIRVTRGAIEQERRRFWRIAIRTKVRLSLEKGEWEGETVDLSLGGMMVKGPGSFPERSMVHFLIDLPGDAQPIAGSGCVMRVLDGNRMGIQFSQMTMGENARLQEFLIPLVLKEAHAATVAGAPR